MSNEGPESPARRDRWLIVRYVAGIALGGVVLVVLVSQRGDVVATGRQLTHASVTWALAAVAAEFASLVAFALLQRRVLATAGARLTVGGLVAISLANNAIANTVPGEPAVSSAFRYREYRRRGASAAGAGWTILTIIVAQAIGLSLLLLMGVLVSLVAGTHGDLQGASLVGLVVVLGAGAVLVRRDVLVSVLFAVVRVTQRVTRHPRGDVAARVTSTLQRMRDITLGARATVQIVGLAVLTWAFDFACLLCAFGAVHAPIPRDGVLLAYGVAQIVAVLPLVPGGLGLVEGSLAVILVAYGATRVPAISTVLVYRFVNYWLAVAVGWTSFGLLAYRVRRSKATTSPHPDVSTPLNDVA